MLRQLLKSKIHLATVTEANLHYQGSLTLGSALVEASGLVEHEYVHITNVNTGAHWVTYVLVDSENPGTVCMNGTAARHFELGDPIIVLAYGFFGEDEAAGFSPRVVHVDQENRVTQVVGG